MEGLSITQEEFLVPGLRFTHADTKTGADNPLMNFSTKIQRHAERLNFNQAELARRATTLLKARGIKKKSVSTTSMNRYWNGTHVPGLHETMAIAAVLGVTVDYLYDDARVEPDNPLSRDEEMILDTFRELRGEGVETHQVIRRMNTALTGITQNKDKAPSEGKKPNHRGQR